MVYNDDVLRSYRYVIIPTQKQARILAEWLERTRELYNAALQERRDAWQRCGVSVSAYDQMKSLPEIREVRPEYRRIPIAVQRGVIRRLDKAFAAFFRRCKAGENPGYPRFRGRGRFESILIDDLGRHPVLRSNRVAVPMLGTIKAKIHRPLEGKPKAMRITQDAGGRWFVTMACDDVPAKPLAPTGQEVGIDLGLTSFIATSDGDKVPRPQTRDHDRALARAQRRVARRKRCGNRRRRAVKLLRKIHARTAAKRRERSILLARALVARYDRIYVENLNIRGLASGMLAKEVNDAAWGDFLHWLRCKAEEAGRAVVGVDPRGTSQVCSGCGVVVQKSLTVREHRCQDCGLVLDRDHNAAINILAAGRAAQGAATPARVRRRSAKSKSSRKPEHTASETAREN